ncbi:hypothetical protein N7520_000503 [Penicillium odoratum]|uniref:uncharacterized protein n=1 Tax=Penicillium odoratum TaxID=1167516 RepID=UPI002549815A|nr:uncharacterized protein N7520_000503 [Penicillium odoratum]KAJ5777257.1 hypothetical protein N7520_000503 [Penicillium odoratum]
MPVSAEDIVKHYENDDSAVQRISFAKNKRTVALTDYNPSWPSQYQFFKDGIISELGSIAITVSHVGSTSVPGLSAKDIIDIDLTVANILDEDAYVPLLERAGWSFRLREPTWHQHRFFSRDEPYGGNLHVWGPDCAEAERHLIFRDWLLNNPEDQDLYMQAKHDAALDTVKVDGTVMDYNFRKEKRIREILERAFRSRGYLKDEGADQDGKLDEN